MFFIHKVSFFSAICRAGWTGQIRAKSDNEHGLGPHVDSASECILRIVHCPRSNLNTSNVGTYSPQAVAIHIPSFHSVIVIGMSECLYRRYLLSNNAAYCRVGCQGSQVEVEN